VPISPDLNERMLEALRGSGKVGHTHTFHLSIGGYVEVVVNEPDATMVGLFNRSVDGEVQDLSDITTEPLRYERAEYVHDHGDSGGTELHLHDASGVVDGWFLAMGEELIAYGPLGTSRELEHLDSLQFEEPLIEIE